MYKSTKVSCPTCGAKPGKPCSGTITKGTNHFDRLLKSTKKFKR